MTKCPNSDMELSDKEEKMNWGSREGHQMI